MALPFPLKLPQHMYSIDQMQVMAAGMAANQQQAQ